MAAPPAATASVPQPQHMFVFGVGFVGHYVSERLLAQGWQVSGTCTSATKKRELEALGICASVFDARDGNMSDLHTLQDATHLLISIPPVSGIGDPLLNLNEDLKRILSHGNLQCLCYLSSTSKLTILCAHSVLHAPYIHVNMFIICKSICMLVQDSGAEG
ncbi:hypothetical protein PR202_gb26872 [Eleusine coracana subsp. coracana]|uniref:Uncharacterized protein n=1 Tax=Eleusine coracana subsp. coracana TaxID=191504 RepID=A0AAV5FTK3_ELECO|nr:hypothetical protein PR202_gb26872 [Eleusine coracana subsp. coracana]